MMSILPIDSRDIEELKTLRAFVSFIKDPTPAAKAVSKLSETLDRMDASVAAHQAMIKSKDMIAMAEQHLASAKIEAAKVKEDADKYAKSVKEEADVKMADAMTRLQVLSQKSKEHREKELALNAKTKELDDVAKELANKHAKVDEVRAELEKSHSVLKDKLEKFKQLAG